MCRLCVRRTDNARRRGSACTPQDVVERHLATFANVALGPLDLLGRQATYARIVYAFPSESDPAAYQDVLARKRASILAVTNEYGTTFLLTAGLMNILLILDAFDIGIGRKR